MCSPLEVGKLSLVVSGAQEMQVMLGDYSDGHVTPACSSLGQYLVGLLWCSCQRRALLLLTEVLSWSQGTVINTTLN